MAAELSHHLYSRIKRSAFTEEWIGRCEETIKLFFEAVNLDLSLVTEMLGAGIVQNIFNNSQTFSILYFHKNILSNFRRRRQE